MNIIPIIRYQKTYSVNGYTRPNQSAMTHNTSYSDGTSFNGKYLFTKMNKVEDIDILATLVNSKLKQKGMAQMPKIDLRSVWSSQQRRGFAYQVIQYILNQPKMFNNKILTANLDKIFQSVLTINFNPYSYMNNLEKITEKNYSKETVYKLISGLNLYTDWKPEENTSAKQVQQTSGKKDNNYIFRLYSETEANDFEKSTLNPKLKKLRFRRLDTNGYKPLEYPENYGYSLQTIDYLTSNEEFVKNNHNNLAIAIPLIYEYMLLNTPFPVDKYQHALKYLELNPTKKYDASDIYTLFTECADDVPKSDSKDTQKIEKKDTKTQIKPQQNTNETFNSVGGQEHAKEMLREHIIFPINYPEVYAPIKTEKGVILYGPPGTGKSLIARALANECNANYTYISASANRASLVGESEKNWRNTFKKLEENQPAILFIDEADALCRKRGSHDVHGDSELNQFLQLMSDIEARNLNVYVILATNNIKALDDAILRQGRFGTQIKMLPPQSIEEIEQIFDIHTKNFKFEHGFDKNAVLKELFERNATGADIAGTAKKAYIKSLKRMGIYDMMLKKKSISNDIVSKIKLTNSDFEEILGAIGKKDQKLGFVKNNQ